jgi:AraC family transcriptional regulator of adaptative response / DNA-3-methyladenine glycosylase II
MPDGEGSIFPNAEALADADLTTVGVTGKRAQSIRELALATARGDMKFDGSIDPEQLEEQITRIAGIGPWTAQYIAMRLGEPDAFPATDLYLRHAAHLADAWRPWRAYAAMYLWKRSHP